MSTLKRIALLIIILFPLLHACKKGAGTFILEGAIYDASFNTLLDGASVSLYELSSLGEDEVLIATATSANGAYKLSFKRKVVEAYLLRIEKEGYFLYESKIPFGDMRLEMVNQHVAKVYAKSWAKLVFYNDSPQVSDYLIYKKQEGLIDCPECCDNNEHHLYGAVDTSFYCINNGNTVFSYRYWLNGASSILKSVNTVAFDTTEIYLSY